MKHFFYLERRVVKFGRSGGLEPGVGDFGTVTSTACGSCIRRLDAEPGRPTSYMDIAGMGSRFLSFWSGMSEALKNYVGIFSYGRPGEQGFQSQSIRSRIVVLVAFIVVPLLLSLSWVAFETASLRRQLVEQERAGIARQVSYAVDNEIRRVIGMLTGLAQSNELATSNYAEFVRQADIMVGQQNVENIWVFDARGITILTVPHLGDRQTPLKFSEDVIAQIFSEDQYVSDIKGRGLKDAYVTVAIRVGSENRAPLGIAANIRAAHLSQLFSHAGMSSDWPAAVLDRDGRFVARSLDALRRVGDFARPELIMAARSAKRAGTFENITYEDRRVQNFYLRSKLTNWTTVIAVPDQEITNPWRQTIFLMILGIILTVALSLALASTFAARIAQPVRKLAIYAQSLADGGHSPNFAPGIVELDEVCRALEKTMAQSSRLSAIVSSSDDAIISWNTEGQIQTWNAGAENLLGFREHEVLGKQKTIIIPESNLPEYHDEISKALCGETYRSETIRRHKDGSLIEILLSSAPIVAADGKIIAVSSILHDIRDRKRHEEHITFLMRELAHRSKNQLSVIQSIASQTARSAATTQEFLETFTSRLQGIATSHDLLTTRGWRGAELSEVVRRQLSIFVEWPSQQIDSDGPPVLLDATRAEAIGLALHELATNSVKYGALSVPTGRVSIDWNIANGTDKGQSLLFDWREKHGPVVTVPSRRGFGSAVLERLVAASANGKSELNYFPHGVHWRLECEHSP